MKQIKDDNKGLSILEVLVAMVILAIVVTPFLRSFVTAANANLKAKNIHRATIVGQSIMEGINAEDLESLATQFNYPTVNNRWRLVDKAYINNGTNLTSNVYEVRDVSGTYTTVTKYENVPVSEPDKKAAVTSSVYSTDAGVTGEFLGQSSGIYQFVIKNLKQDKAQYDVLIGLNATSAVGTQTEYNDDDLVQLPILDESQDAICIEQWDYISRAISECGATSINQLEREIEINVEHRATDNKTVVKVTYHYELQSDSSKISEKTLTYFDSAETGQPLRSIYLYYTPLYAFDSAYDMITYTNDSDIPVNLCIFKQKVAAGDANYGSRPAGVVETNTADEQGYKMRLEMNSTGAATLAGSNTKLFTNLHLDMTTGNPVTTKYYSMRFNNINVSVEDITKSDKSTRVFDLTVSVYEKGAASTGFPSDKLLTTIQGSFLD